MGQERRWTITERRGGGGQPEVWGWRFSEVCRGAGRTGGGGDGGRRRRSPLCVSLSGMEMLHLSHQTGVSVVMKDRSVIST